MRRAVTFAALYWLLILVALSSILAQVGRGSSDALDLEDWFGLMLSMILILVLQIMLLIAPARLSAGLLVSRRLLLVPLLASSVLLGFLLFASEMAIGEFTGLLNDLSIWMIVAPAAVGIGSALIQYRMSRSLATRELIRRQRSALIAPGVLLLLVTIPAHVVTVQREGFLAGLGTGTGMAASLVVILLAMGELLFSRLFAKRNGAGLPEPSG